MFKTWLVTKINRYTVSGDYRNQGSVTEQRDENGNIMYIHDIYNDDGVIVKSYVDDDPRGGMVKYHFKTSYNQGILQSLRQAYYYAKDLGLKGAYHEINENDPVVRRNIKYLTGDLLTCLILFLIGKLLLDANEIRKEYGVTAQRLLYAPLNAPVDNNPLELVNLFLGSTEPPVISSSLQILNSIGRVITSPSMENLSALPDNVSAIRYTRDAMQKLFGE